MKVWVSNILTRHFSPDHDGLTLGEPQAEDGRTVEELKAAGVSGLYREVPGPEAAD